jgi:hypothetical protein
LLEAGVVELIRPQVSRAHSYSSLPQPSSLTKQQKDERKSLIARIIDRIRAL